MPGLQKRAPVMSERQKGKKSMWKMVDLFETSPMKLQAHEVGFGNPGAAESQSESLRGPGIWWYAVVPTGLKCWNLMHLLPLFFSFVLGFSSRTEGSYPLSSRCCGTSLNALAPGLHCDTSCSTLPSPFFLLPSIVKSDFCVRRQFRHSWN